VDHINRDATWWAERAATLAERVRTHAPQVHVLTSTVAQPLSANLLLAAGAQPSMSAAAGEIEAFAERTDALIANLGMLDESRRDAIERTLPILRARGVPWVLDPVKIERSPRRLAFAAHLLDAGPTVVRGNRDEMATLPAASSVVMATTGAIDVVRAGQRQVAFGGGHPLMGSVTAMGCAATTLIGAFLAVERDAFVACAGALFMVGAAGAIAGETARGPGSFSVHFLDTLHRLTPEQIAARARLA
jgi:hydroxyethylthiazole kinase